jgi:outer membrane protein
MVKVFAGFLSICFVGCGSVFAQTPAANLMPDGSHDLYIGLGAESSAIYQGAHERKMSPLPVLQMQWSNGVFVAGMSAGVHLSDQVRYEYGPMIALEGRRTSSGTSTKIGMANNTNQPGTVPGGSGSEPDVYIMSNRLVGMDDINLRLLSGVFYHVNVSEAIRLNNNVLYGAGNSHDGLSWSSDVLYHTTVFSPRHTVSVSLGATVVNRAYNQAYFGVTPAESQRSHNPVYMASAGIKDVHIHGNWNWALSANWLLTSKFDVTRLHASAANSPLVERRCNVTLSSALAYRF